MSICPHYDEHMDANHAHGSFVPFTLPLEDDGHVQYFKGFAYFEVKSLNRNHVRGARDVQCGR